MFPFCSFSFLPADNEKSADSEFTPSVSVALVSSAGHLPSDRPAGWVLTGSGSFLDLSCDLVSLTSVETGSRLQLLDFFFQWSCRVSFK